VVVNGSPVQPSINLTDTWTSYSASFTAPANAVVDVGFSFSGKAYLDLVTLVCMVGATWQGGLLDLARRVCSTVLLAVAAVAVAVAGTVFVNLACAAMCGLFP
jgi:hypothetical protein